MNKLIRLSENYFREIKGLEYNANVAFDRMKKPSTQSKFNIKEVVSKSKSTYFIEESKQKDLIEYLNELKRNRKINRKFLRRAIY